MEAGGHLDRVGGVLVGAFGVVAGPVAADDSDTGVAAEPDGRWLGGLRW